MLALAPLASAAWTISIVGAQGGLGQELVRQSLNSGHTVKGIVRRPLEPVLEPVRKGWLDPEPDKLPRFSIFSTRLSLTSELDASDSDAVVFCMSGKPFSSNDSTETVRAVCDSLRPDTKVVLVSAHGVGDKDADVGIRAMRNWYLKDTYDAKYAQELIVQQRPLHLVLRPRVLSYEPIPMNPISTTRKELAGEILDWIDAS